MKPKRNACNKKLSGAGFISMLFVALPVFFSVQILGSMSPCYAGAYIFAGEDNGIDVVTHPSGYTGTGGVLTVGVCIDPSSENAADMEISIQNIVDTFNAQTITTDNLKTGGSNNIPDNFFDFESVALHEVGHCIGLAHVNASSESGLAVADMNYTKATDGADNTFNIAPGADNIIGSSDDIRGDDVNLHWFNDALNNPFQLTTPTDSTTYSRTIADLPAGHDFTINADRDVSTLLGVPNSEAIMQQGTGIDEAQRTLVADDVATLRYAMSGLDEVAGNADDYTLNLEYRGISSGAGCDITIKMLAINGLAFCLPNGQFINGSDHVRITSADISIDAGESGPNWFFNDVRNIAADTTPSVFSFVDQTDVVLNGVTTSTSITVLGVNSATAISVTNGDYSINSGPFTSTAGVVNNGNTVRVRHTSATTVSTATNTTLDIGGVTDVFTSTTISLEDTVPNAFSFTSLVDAAIGTLVVSNAIAVSGLTSSTVISVSGGEYRINTGSFVSVDGTINSNDTVVMRHITSSNFSTATRTSLTIGGVTGTYTSTTEAAPSGGGGGSSHPVLALVLLYLISVGFCRRKPA